MKYIDNRLNANIVKLEDANNNYVSENVEGALEEIDSKIKIIEANSYDDAQIKQEINNIKTEIGTEELTATNQTIKGAITEIDSQIKKNTGEINNIKDNIPYEEYDRNKSTSTLGKTYKHYDGFSSFVKKTYGRYETATVNSVIANSDDNRPQVLGTDTKGLATYTNRDSVAFYVSNTGNGSILTITNGTTFTDNTVTLPSVTDISNIKVGMIVDVFNSLIDINSNWYVGIIKEIDVSNKKLVMEDGFYLCRNDGVEPTKGIPTNGYTVRIQNNNKVWSVNSNLFIKKGTSAGTNMELGVFSSHTAINDVGGIDLINFEQPTHYGIKVRGLAHGFQEGFVSENNGAHFIGKGGDVNIPLLKCITPKGHDFEITMDGALSTQTYKIQFITESASVNSKAGIIIANGSNINVSLPLASDFPGRIIEIISIGTGNLLTAQTGNAIKTPTLEQQQTSIAKKDDVSYRALRFVSDGGRLWFCLSDL